MNEDQEMSRATADADDEPFFGSFEDSDSEQTVVIEEDEEVAYAYLLVAGEIISHVWLYDRASDDEGREVDRGRAVVPRLHSAAAVQCTWSGGSVAIEVDGVVVARLRADTKPGWSLGASKPGALALPLSMYPDTVVS